MFSIPTWYRSDARQDEFRLSQAGKMWISKVRGVDHVCSRWSAAKKKKKRAKPSYKPTKHIERTSLHFTSDDIAGKVQVSAWFLNEQETVVSSNAITFLASNRSFSVSDSSQSSQRMVTIYGLQKASSGRMGRRISAVGPRNGRYIHSWCSEYQF